MYENLSLYPKNMAERNLSALKKELLKYDKMIVAFSGGLDSALLLAVANEVMGENVLAVISDSPSVPRSELNSAVEFAKKTGARLRVVKTKETEKEDYILNPVNRCYFCKTELYDHIEEVADEEGIRYIANGTNMDDLGDHRPGLVAADEHEVVSPLRDAELKKEDIRMIAKMLELDVWDKPPSPCLASRIPYGKKVTPEKLSQVEKAEEFVKSFGVKELRVRHFDDKAVLEVNPLFLETVQHNLNAIEAEFQKIGFDSIAIKEFKSGSLNKLANIDAKRQA